MQIIEPIWTTKTETASRLRGRLYLILDSAKARNYRTGENRGALARPSLQAAAQALEGGPGQPP